MKFLKIKSVFPVLAMAFLVSCGKNGKQTIPVFTVQKGVFQNELTEEGEVMATNSFNISAPNLSSWRYGSLKITGIVDDGSEVGKGDTVVTFDPSEVKKSIVDSESSLEISKAEFEKMVAQHASDLEDLLSDYEVSRINREISQIKFENSDYLSEIERKKIELNLKKSEIDLEKALEQIENKKKIQFEEVQQRKLAIQQSQTELDEAHETLNKLFLVSESPGIAIITENWTSGNKFQVGDQCWSGHTLVQLPDLTDLKARVKINEVDVSKIKKGLPVEIRPDAYSDRLFKGEIVSIANLAVNKERNSKIKVFPVDISITDSVINELMPGLTVSCKIIIDEIEDVLLVPIESVFSLEGKDVVYVKQGSGFKPKHIKKSLANNDFFMIDDGLKAGDEIALVNPIVEKNGNNE